MARAFILPLSPDGGWTVKSYAIGILEAVDMGAPIVEYWTRIDSTLEPFEGRFVMHGGETELLEGTGPGNVVIIEFPDRERARSWYASAAYREILPLRVDNSKSTVAIVDAVERARPAPRGDEPARRWIWALLLAGWAALGAALAVGVQLVL